mgnify:CR=1 FL=1
MLTPDTLPELQRALAEPSRRTRQWNSPSSKLCNARIGCATASLTTRSAKAASRATSTRYVAAPPLSFHASTTSGARSTACTNA